MSDQRTTRIVLERPIVGHEPIKELVLRDPTYADFMTLGEPWTISYTSDKLPFMVNEPAIVNAYVERCLTAPKDTLLLDQCTLKDARKVKDWLMVFFEGEEKKSEPSTTSPATSSSSVSSTLAQ